MEEEQVEQELPPGEPQTFGEKMIHHTPWWAISTGLHVVLALIIGFLWAVQAREDDEAEFIRSYLLVNHSFDFNGLGSQRTGGPADQEEDGRSPRKRAWSVA